MCAESAGEGSGNCLVLGAAIGNVKRAPLHGPVTPVGQGALPLVTRGEEAGRLLELRIPPQRRRTGPLVAPARAHGVERFEKIAFRARRR
jgi:hypothetical protein